MTTDPFALADQAAAALAERTGRSRHDVVVVLGSGWADVADAIGSGVEVPLADLPGFPAPTAIGHRGTMRSTQVGTLRVLVLQGRSHLYEGHEPSVVVHGVRTAGAAGCRVAVLTNAAGSLHSRWPVGQPVLLTDHVNLTGRSPLTGPPPPDGIRFVDMTEAYSRRLRAIAHAVDTDLREGVYVGFHGPQYETPAEVHMAGVLGGDLVGMSTVLETIAARHLGMEVLGVSLASNLAAGISATPLGGDEVIEAARAAAPRMGRLIRGVLDRLAGDAG